MFKLSMLGAASAASWNYKQQGKDWWGDAAHPFCDDNQQSPIDLTDDFPKVRKQNDMHTTNYDGWNSAQRVFTHQTVKYMPAWTAAAGEGKLD